MKRTTPHLPLCVVCLFLLLIATSAGSAKQGGCDTPFPKIFEQVSDSVVLITAVSLNPFSIEERISTSMGSGFIIDKTGIILTNSHVVFGQQAVSVTTKNGTIFPAEIKGADPILDLAVLKIDPRGKDLPALSLAGETLPQIGEDVIAVGNPLGFEKTLTKGVVSGVNRVLPISPMSMMVPMIQTDAAINPGNSGGPLINRCGRVVGINTSVLTGAENMGFALPATIVQRVLPQLIQAGRIMRPWIGIRGKLINKEDLGTIFNFDLENGYLVEMVEPGSPADLIGIRGGMMPIRIAGEEFLFGGEIITRINGVSVSDPAVFRDALQKVAIGDKIRITVYGQGKKREIDLNVVERPLMPWDLPRGDCHMATP